MKSMSDRFNLQSVKIIAFAVALIWFIHLVTSLAPSLKGWGIYPRTLSGLSGIFSSPLIHLDMGHLINNTTALIFLGLIFLFLEQTRAGFIFIGIYFFSGLGTWIIGSAGKSHIGASGVIYGLLGYLLSIGIFRKSLLTILLSAGLFFVYGATLWGMLPFFTPSHVSWQAHLAGFVAGIAVALSEARINK